MFTATAPPALYTLSLHDALPICTDGAAAGQRHPRLALARQQRPEHQDRGAHLAHDVVGRSGRGDLPGLKRERRAVAVAVLAGDRKSTRLNSSHVSISYAVFCLKK